MFLTLSRCSHSNDPFPEISIAQAGSCQRTESNSAIPRGATCGWGLRVCAPLHKEGQGGRPENRRLSLSRFPSLPLTGWSQTSPQMSSTGVGGTRRRQKGVEEPQGGKQGSEAGGRDGGGERGKSGEGRRGDGGREGGGVGRDPGSAAAGPRGEQGRRGREAPEAEVFRAGGPRSPPMGRGLKGAWRPRRTHIMLVGHPPLLHVQHLHLHDAAPRRHGRPSARSGSSAGAGDAGCGERGGRAAAGREPGAERDRSRGRARAAAATAAALCSARTSAGPGRRRPPPARPPHRPPALPARPP